MDKYTIQDIKLREIIDKHSYTVDELIKPICMFLKNSYNTKTSENVLDSATIKIENILQKFSAEFSKKTEQNNILSLENVILKTIPQQASSIATEIVNKTFMPMASLNEKMNTISSDITELKKEKIIKQTGSAIKGLECEKNYFNILSQRLPSEWTCQHIGSERATSGNMDIILYRNDDLVINIEIKDYDKPIGTNITTKFIEDAKKNNNSAIIISANSDFVGFYNRKIVEFKSNKFAIFLSQNRYNYADIWGSIELISLLNSYNIKNGNTLLTDNDIQEIETDFIEFTNSINIQKQRTTYLYNQTMDFYKTLEFKNTKRILKLTATTNILCDDKKTIYTCLTCNKTYKTAYNFNKHKSICI